MTTDNQELRQRIMTMVETMNPKSYTRSLKSKPELQAEVDAYCKDFPIDNMGEKLWLYVNNETPAQCSEGSAIPFNSFTHGYRLFCSLGCKCRTSHHSATIKRKFANDASYAANLAEARVASSRAKYGVDNHMQSREFLDSLKARNLEEHGYEFKIGTKEVQDKIKETTRVNLGVDYAFQSKEVQEKAKETFEENHGAPNTMQFPREAILEKYGVSSTWLTPEGQKAAKDGMVKKYGVEHAFHSTDLYQKFTDTMFARHGRTNPAQLHLTDDQMVLTGDESTFRSFVNGKTFMAIERESGLSESIVRRVCIKFQCVDLIDKRGRSRHESDIAAFLDSIGVPFQQDNRSILVGKRELDFYIPDFNLAIELNGVYWHSEIAGGKDKNYHKAKTDECDSKGIQLLSILDSEWDQKTDIVKSKIRSMCGQGVKGLGARKLRIEKIESSSAKVFLEKYHIQGHAHYSSYHLGAIDANNDIRGILSIRESDKGSEITRFACDAHHPGLFSKMLRELKGSVFTFADRRVSKGNLYELAGGKTEYVIAPDYSYTWDYETVEHKTNYRKEKIAAKFGIDLGTMTEWEAMQMLGFDRIWDAGKIKYSWNL